MKHSVLKTLLVIMTAFVALALLAGCADPALRKADDTILPGNHAGNNEPDTTAGNEVTTEAETDDAQATAAQGTVNFVKDADGKIVGSPCDYNIYFDVEGLTFTAAEYKNNMQSYALTLYDMLADEAPYKADKLKNGRACAHFNYSPDFGLADVVYFSATVPGQVICYGASGGHPDDLTMVDYKMNGISLGDNVQDALDCFGTPSYDEEAPCEIHWNGPGEEPDEGCSAHYYWYFFQDGSRLRFNTIGDGTIINLGLEYTPITFED